MGRTIPTAAESTQATIRGLRVIRDYLNTSDKKLWDEFMATGRTSERAISLGVFYDPFDALVLAMLFKQFKMIRRLGGDVSEWNEQGTLDPHSGDAPAQKV